MRTPHVFSLRLAFALALSSALFGCKWFSGGGRTPEAETDVLARRSASSSAESSAAASLAALGKAFPRFEGEVDGFEAISGPFRLARGGAPYDLARRLLTWDDALDEVNDILRTLDATTRKSAALNEEYGTKIIDVAEDSPTWFRGVASDGELQAAAILAPVKDESYVIVDLVATAPWNLRGVTLPRRRNIRGAGTALIKFIAMESVARGKKGRLLVESDADAVGFYASLGFKSQGKAGATEYMLLEEGAAQELIARQEAARR